MPAHPLSHPDRPATRWAVRTAVRRLWPLHIDGPGSIPLDGPAILAPNHRSFFDSIALLAAAPRPITFVGKAEYLDDWKTRRLFPALGMIPIDRDRPGAAARALEAAAGVLHHGGLFAIYPEGTRSGDGRLQRGRCGVAHLSLTTGAPIIPVGLSGTDHIQPPGAPVPRPGRAAVVRIGTPLHPDGYAGTARQRRRALTADVMASIAALAEQADAHRSRPARAAATPPPARRPVPAPT